MNSLFYNYPCKLIRVIDGDTLELEIDLGFRIKRTEKVRLLGFDAPEVRTLDEHEKEVGLQATTFLNRMLSYKSDMYLSSFKGDSFGRWLGDMYYRIDGQYFSVNNQMREYLHAIGWLE